MEETFRIFGVRFRIPFPSEFAKCPLSRMRLVINTLPETNMAPENRPSQKETIVFQPSIFRCKQAVSGREGSLCFF